MHIAISGQSYYYMKIAPLVCSANGFSTIITLLILGTTFSIYYFDFLEDILHFFTQAFNLGRIVSEKHNNKDTNWKATQKQQQTIS